MAALGNSDDGVTENPSVLRQENEGQLQNVTIVDQSFSFDDEGNPTSVTVEFELEEGAAERDLHLAVYILPGPFDISEIDDQELYASTSDSFEGGEEGQFTLDIPQESDGGDTTPQQAIVVPTAGFGVGTIGLVLFRRQRGADS